MHRQKINERDLGGGAKAGASNATFDLAEIRDLLSHDTFKGKFLTAIGKAEWHSLNWTQAVADKQNIINNSDIVFTASYTVDSTQKSLKTLRQQNVKSHLFHCSDAHYFSDSEQPNKIGHCFTWIKADTTFDGLAFALKEYSDRIYLGDLPEKVKKVKSNPTKFIDKIVIKKKTASTFREKWFDHELKFNFDLVAIVGNKGSGKSALADIIGLLGNSII